MNNGTTGLGEYTDAELLAELVERGVMQRIIGNEREYSDKNPKWYQRYGEYVNTIKDKQRQRIQDILGGKK